MLTPHPNPLPSPLGRGKRRVKMTLFPEDKTQSPIIYLAVIFLVTFGIYWNSLQGEFIWDDRGLIVDHADYLNDWKNFFTVFTQPFFGDTPFYRPLLIGSFIVDYQLWGLHPFGYHFSNVLLHALNACMVYLFAFLLFKERTVAFIAGMLFAAHPIQTEAVAWISGRNDVLLTFFSLLTVLLYLRWRSNLKGMERLFTYLGFLASYACVLLTKESGIIVFVLIMLVDYFFRTRLPDPLEGRRKVYLPLLLIALVYFLVRMGVLGNSGMETGGQGFIPLFLGMTGTYAYYGKMLLLPLVQSATPVLPSLTSFKDPACSASLFFVASLVIITVLCWRNFRELSFTILWIVVALFPVSGIVSLTFPALEHRLYLASVCFSMMIPLLLYRVSLLTHDGKFSQGARKMTPLIVLLLIFVYSIKTVTRNTVWRDERHFWLHTVRHQPLSACAHNNLGIVHAREGRLSEAIQSFEKAISLNGDQHAVIPQCNPTKAYNNLGRTYYTMLEELFTRTTDSPDPGALGDPGVTVESERKRLYHNSFRCYQKALHLSPDNVEAHNNLGDLHYLMHSYQAAEQEYRRAVQFNPSYAEAYNNLGVIYLEIERYHDAEKEFIKALEVKPHFLEARNNLALVYLQVGLYHKALQALQEVVRVVPDNADVHFNLALLYVRGFKDREKGSYHLNESLRLKPSQSRARAIEDDLSRLASAESLEN